MICCGLLRSLDVFVSYVNLQGIPAMTGKSLGILTSDEKT